MKHPFTFLQKFWTASIRRQLMLGIILVHAVLMSIFVYDLTSRQRDFLHSQSTEQAKSLSTILAANSVSWVLANDVIGLEETLKSQTIYPSLRYAMVLNPRGRVLGHTERDKVGKYVNDDVSKKLLTGEKQQIVLVDNALDVDVATPITNQGKFIGWARVNLSKKDTTKSLQVITRDGLLYTVLAIVVGAFFAFFMAKGITKGLNAIVEVAKGIKKGDLTLRADTERYDEIGELGEDINLMLDTIEKNKRELQDIMDNSPAVIYAKDKHGRYIFINQKWENLFDKERKGIVGKTDHEIFEKDFADKFVENDKTVFATGNAIYTEEIAPHEDGIHTYDSVKFPLYDDNNNIYAICGISTDITQRIAIEKEKASLEQQLHHTQKMQSIGQLTGGIAHDFNNLLAVILGYTELSQQTFSKDNPELDKYLQEIYKAGTRGRDLIDQMMIFSRKDQSRDIFAPIDIGKSIGETISMLRSTLPASIEITTLIEDNIPCVDANPTLIGQIMMNLCINAKDSMNADGKLTISLNKMHFNDENCNSCHERFSGDFIVIGVKDTGHGMGDEIINRMFEPFFTSKGVGEGTGMGLSVVHGAVHKLGGHILVNSEINVGTEFKILLPVSDTKVEIENLKSSVSEVKNDFSGLSIMIVDDEPAVIDFVKELLVRYHAKVQSFSDSKKALEYVEAHPDEFDIVLTDQTMPGINGGNMSKKILEINPSISIALFTGFSEEINEESAHAIGIKEFAYKPVSAQKLYSIINKLK